MNAARNLAVVLASALAYFALCWLNGVLFSSLGYSSGVDWVFLPSGLRLAFVLIFVEWGALGIALATGWLARSYALDPWALSFLGTGLISGFVPLLARRVCIDLFKLDVNLHQLSAAALIQTSVVFALFSAVLHQLWYTGLGLTENFISSTLVMLVGDLTGTLIVLYLAKALLGLLPVPRHSDF